MQIYKYSFLSIIVAYNSHYYPLLTFAWRPCNLCDHLSWFDLKQRHISYLSFIPNSSFYLKVGMSRNLYSQSAAVCPLTISIILNQMCYFVALYIKLPSLLLEEKMLISSAVIWSSDADFYLLSFKFCFSRSLNAVDRKMQILSASLKVLFPQVFNCCG